jgi:hypothetical protein
MKKIIVYSGYVIVLTLLFASCKKDEAKPSGELSQEIKNFVPDTLLQDIMALGMPINKGLTPPNFENIYFGSPFALVNSNISYDYEGKLFADYKVQFFDQDNENLTVKVSYVNGPEEGSGLGAFISGSGDKFSVFVQVNSTYSGTNAVMLHIISGTLTSTGIKDLYFANFMLNNYGNEYGYWIQEGEGRVIKDTDGNSPIISSLKSSILREGKSRSASIGTK